MLLLKLLYLRSAKFLGSPIGGQSPIGKIAPIKPKEFTLYCTLYVVYVGRSSRPTFHVSLFMTSFQNPKREQKEPQHHTSGYFWHTKVHRKLTGNMKLTFTFAILALSLQGLLVAAADHDLTDEQAGTKTLEVDGIMCSDPCHKDATCTATDAGLFECKLQVQWRPHWGRSHRLQSASWSIGRFLHYGAQACS